MENYENDEAIEKQKEIFYQIVWSCLRDYPQTRLRPLPVMIAQGKHVDLFEVSTRVRDLGGFDAVTQKKLWPSIASESLGLDPSCGAALKLVFLKYLKQPQKWLQRGCTSRARGSIVDGPVQDSRAERKKASKRRRDSLAEMLESLRFVAKNAGSELKGAWLEECVPRALKARALLFGSSGNFALKKIKKHKIHRVRYEERTKAKTEDLAGQLAIQTSVPVYDFPLQPFTPPFASFLPGVHPICDMVTSIKTGEAITQNSDSLPSICNDTSCKVDIKVHIPRKRVRIGPEFQAKVPVWDGPLKKSPQLIGNGDSSFEHYMDDSRWLLPPIWPMEYSDVVVNKERIGKGRSDGCFCALQGSIECVKLHIKDEREKLKKELGVSFSDWRFEDMGDTVSEKWSEEEKQKFSALVRLNPASLEKNFWNYLPTCLPAKKIEDLEFLISKCFQPAHFGNFLEMTSDISKPLAKRNYLLVSSHLMGKIIGMGHIFIASGISHDSQRGYLHRAELMRCEMLTDSDDSHMMSCFIPCVWILFLHYICFITTKVLVHVHIYFVTVVLLSASVLQHTLDSF